MSIEEKKVNISQNTTPHESAEKPVRSSRKNNKKKERKNSDVISNILTFVALTGIIVGGAILGTTLWSEWQRSKETQGFINQATELTKDFILKDDFHPVEGDVVGLIILPEQNNLEVAIIEGVRDEDLHAGIGHYPITGWPTEQRQIFLAGHRNTEFGALQYVQKGETIVVKMVYGSFTYRVTDMVIVNENQSEVIQPNTFFEHDQLVLMTCYPFTFGATTEQRYLVYAERIDV